MNGMNVGYEGTRWKALTGYCVTELLEGFPIENEREDEAINQMGTRLLKSFVETCGKT
jgi:hypothetical protein